MTGSSIPAISPVCKPAVGQVPASWAHFQGAEVRCQGQCVQVHLKAEGARPGCRRRVGGPRGVVFEMSGASRRRLMSTAARMEWTEQARPVVFLTLTFGSVFPTARDSKRYLDRFLRRLLRRFPAASFIWRKELQQRGAPHFHLLCFGLPWVPKESVSKWWNECIAELVTPDERARGGVFTRIEALRSWRRARAYVSKYMSKGAGGLDHGAYLAAGVLDDEGEVHSSGRWWGIVNADCLPWADGDELLVDFGRWFFAFRRVASRIWPGVVGEYPGGFTLYVDNWAEWWRLCCVLSRSVDGSGMVAYNSIQG